MVVDEEVLTYFEYEHFVLIVFHRLHCSRMIDGEEVLTSFEYEHFVLAVFHRHHCSHMVNDEEVFDLFRVRALPAYFYPSQPLFAHGRR
jgi:hypothetical protein|mmetsp:Transcript_82289/g.164497  ORF Transcript_82289/g.164497 Transcript_82289/m.164497 type:complete len:89 (-) Transcript_82289:138-404(-)